MVPGARIELATPAFSGRRSTNELPRHVFELSHFRDDSDLCQFASFIHSCALITPSSLRIRSTRCTDIPFVLRATSQQPESLQTEKASVAGIVAAEARIRCLNLELKTYN